MITTYVFILILTLGAAGLAAPASTPSTAQPARVEPAERPAAPDFEDRALDGRTVTLSDVRDKNSVVQPVKDRVVFPPLMVDARGSADKVRAFVATKEWRSPFHLGERAIGAKGGVSGIPHTMIVAKDGSFVATHVGFPSESEWKELLLKDLDAAIAIE